MVHLQLYTIPTCLYTTPWTLSTLIPYPSLAILFSVAMNIEWCAYIFKMIVLTKTEFHVVPVIVSLYPGNNSRSGCSPV